MRKNVLEYLESSARTHADKVAFLDDTRSFTFGELLTAAQASLDLVQLYDWLGDLDRAITDYLRRWTLADLARGAQEPSR